MCFLTIHPLLLIVAMLNAVKCDYFLGKVIVICLLMIASSDSSIELLRSSRETRTVLFSPIAKSPQH